MGSEFTGIFILVLIVMGVIMSGIMTNAATEKGYVNSEMKIFTICFFFGIFGYLYVVALPDKTVQEQNKEIIELLRRQSTNQPVEKKVEDNELPKL